LILHYRLKEAANAHDYTIFAAVLNEEEVVVKQIGNELDYLPFKIALTDGQKKKLQKAFAAKLAVTLCVKPEQIGRGDELLLTGTQINKMKKAASERRGADLKMSKTQIEKTAQRGGSIFSSLFSLARQLIKPAIKALASAGLSFGAEKN